MRVLFLHPNFPAQYRHMAAALGREEGNEVVFATQAREGEIAGVRKVYFKTAREPAAETHHYVRPLERAVLTGQAAFRTVLELKQQGFVPDLVCGHAGWGTTQFVKDVYPETPFLGFFEWYYNALGSDVGFLKEDQVGADDRARVRVKNAAILLDLVGCDWGVTPTAWQHEQFPAEFRGKLVRLHEGIDTGYFAPSEGARLVLPGLDLSGVDEVVTYVARGMEPYRGFPQFIEALALIQARRPNCHAVIVGADRVAYGAPLPDGQTYKEKMLAEVPLDLERVHFTGLLPYDQYREVLRASSVHVYLTVPFVLSWSLLEAMAAGCLVVGSDTAPVREVVVDGESGLLVDFFSPQTIAERVDEALDHPDRRAALRAAARATIVERFDLAKLLPRQLQLMEDVARGVVPETGNS